MGLVFAERARLPHEKQSSAPFTASAISEDLSVLCVHTFLPPGRRGRKDPLSTRRIQFSGRHTWEPAPRANRNQATSSLSSFPRRRESRDPGIWIPDLRDATSGMTVVDIHSMGARPAGEWDWYSPRGLGSHKKNSLRHLSQPLRPLGNSAFFASIPDPSIPPCRLFG